ncbi:hypothetical protein H8356DRAFT_1364720 [Neocallimastix lanati (nom. inval.)]|nr:hypothetical protein H8356DRAFT_1364720 [Neocallimastix sp. JGI-2020a]
MNYLFGLLSLFTVPFWHFICKDDIYAYKNELRKYGDHPPPIYNILDSILNNKNYDKFKIITDFLYKFWNELPSTTTTLTTTTSNINNNNNN